MATPETFLKGNQSTWRLLREIGRGRFGTVYEAADETGAKAAVKCLNSQYADDDLAVRRLLREVAAVSRFEHDAFLNVLDVGIAPDRTPFYVMDFLEGETLA